MSSCNYISDSDRSRFGSDITDAVEWLAQFGKDPDGGVTRLLYTAPWIAAQRALAERMEQAGLQTQYDDCGNLYGRLEGRDPDEDVILTGSHIDTVTRGGKYDGAYGILAGVLALEYLHSMHGQPLRTIEVVSLCEEEGSRFPLTYWGSGNMTGRYTVRQTPSITDKEGIPLQAAMEAAGFGMGKFAPPKRQNIGRFIELHIEQGLILEREQSTIGIVEGIVGQRRYTIRVKGIANHAGTTPMRYRSDALAGACEMIGFLEQEALARSEPFVATAGQLHVQPNSSNVIPSVVTFTVDIRDANADNLKEFCSTFRQAFTEIAAQRSLEIEFDEWMNMVPTAMDEAMNRDLMPICEARQLSYRHMFSGAGHDAQVISSICPTTMLFIPSQAGISHSPLESSKTEDLVNGIVVLTELLYRYGYQ